MGIARRFSSGERESMILCWVRKGLHVRQYAAALLESGCEQLTNGNQLEDGKAWVCASVVYATKCVRTSMPPSYVDPDMRIHAPCA